MHHWIHAIFEDVLWEPEKVPSHVESGLKRIIELIETSEYHLFRTEEMESLSNALLVSDDLETLSEIMWKVATSAEFQNFTVFVINQGSAGTFKSRVCTSFNERWIAHYEKESYQFIDPVMLRAMGSDGAFVFSELENDSPAVERFWEDADRHKIGRNGLCFTQTFKDNTRVGVSFTTMNSAEMVRETVRLNGSDLQILACMAAERFCYASFGPMVSDSVLSVDELRFLHVLSSSSHPEEALKISAVYGSNKSLQASIRKKLNLDSIYQAVALAVSKGWFNQLPYRSNEVLKPFKPLEGMDLFQNDSFQTQNDPESVD